MTRAVLLAMLTLSGCGIGSGAPRAAADRELSSGRYRQALAAYRDIDRDQPGDGRVLHQTGAALYRLGDYAGAVSAFGSAADRLSSPNDRARALHNLGNALVESGRATEALEAYRQALGLDDRESTRLNYELVHDRLASDSRPADGPSLRSSPARDDKLFEAARELDISPDARPAPKGSSPRVRDW